jgi:hypothetical protein
MKTYPTGTTFGRFCRALAIAKGDPLSAEAYAEAQPWDDRVAIVSSLKGLMTPHATGDYAGSSGPVFTDFAEFLRPQTLVGRLTSLRRVPFNVRMVTGIGGSRAAWVTEGETIPASYSSFETADALPIRKVATIACIGDELVRASKPTADAVVAADVGAAIVEQMDRAFIDPSYGATDTRPASVTFGATQLDSSGSTVAAIDSDLEAMVQVLVDAGMQLNTAAWILHPRTAVHLALKRGANDGLAYPGMTVKGGTLAGLPAFVSSACSASGSPAERNITLLEVGEVNLADSGAGDLDASRYAALQLDDAPANSAQPLTSLWTHGLVGLKATRFLNWAARRQGVAAVLRNVAF